MPDRLRGSGRLHLLGEWSFPRPPLDVLVRFLYAFRLEDLGTRLHKSDGHIGLLDSPWACRGRNSSFGGTPMGEFHSRVPAR